MAQGRTILRSACMTNTRICVQLKILWSSNIHYAPLKDGMIRPTSHWAVISSVTLQGPPGWETRHYSWESFWAPVRKKPSITLTHTGIPKKKQKNKENISSLKNKIFKTISFYIKTPASKKKKKENKEKKQEIRNTEVTIPWGRFFLISFYLICSRFSEKGQDSGKLIGKCPTKWVRESTEAILRSPVLDLWPKGRLVPWHFKPGIPADCLHVLQLRKISCVWRPGFTRCKNHTLLKEKTFRC